MAVLAPLGHPDQMPAGVEQLETQPGLRHERLVDRGASRSCRGRGLRGRGLPDIEPQLAVLGPGADLDRRPARAHGDAVRDGALRERQQDQVRHGRVEDLGGDGVADFEPVLQARLLDLEVEADVLELGLQRHEPGRVVVEREAEDVAELDDRPRGRAGLGADEGQDRRERVEEKRRMETELERLELRLDELALELRSLDLLLAEGPIVVDAPGHAHDADERREPRRAAERQRREEHGREIPSGFPRVEHMPEDVRREQVQKRRRDSGAEERGDVRRVGAAPGPEAPRDAHDPGRQRGPEVGRDEARGERFVQREREAGLQGRSPQIALGGDEEPDERPDGEDLERPPGGRRQRDGGAARRLEEASRRSRGRGEIEGRRRAAAETPGFRAL